MTLKSSIVAQHLQQRGLERATNQHLRAFHVSLHGWAGVQRAGSAGRFIVHLFSGHIQRSCSQPMPDVPRKTVMYALRQIYSTQASSTYFAIVMLPLGNLALHSLSQQSYLLHNQSCNASGLSEFLHETHGGTGSDMTHTGTRRPAGCRCGARECGSRVRHETPRHRSVR